MTFRIPVSLKFTVPLILLGFAAILSAINLLYYVPQAEQASVEDSRKRLAQDISRLQSTLEYLVLKGDVTAAQHEIAVLAHNHEVNFAALTNDQQEVIAATRRAWLGKPIADVLPQLDLSEAAEAISQRRAGMSIDATGDELLGYTGILSGSERTELRPSRTASLFLSYDLKPRKAEARAHVLQQSLYWSGWVTALALAMWLVFHFLLTRRTARLVGAAEQLAAGSLDVRSGLHGSDELGRLGRAFDAMAVDVAETQTRLRNDIAMRERVQRDLANSEARLAQILNNATAMVTVKDTDGKILFVNREWERVFSLRSGDVAGKTDAECLAGPIAREFRENDLTVLERNTPMEFEESVPLGDGVHTYLSMKFPLHDENGLVYAVCAICTDITERKRSAEALRISEASYRAIFDAAEDAILVRDVDTGAIVDANPAACAAFGYTREELRQLQMGALSAGKRPDAEDNARDLRARAARGEDLRVEWHSRSKDGRLRWFEVVAKRVTIGGQDRILSLSRDIDDRKAAEEALVASEEQYRSMFNASIDGLALWNASGELVDTNPALWRMYGYGDQESEAMCEGGWAGPTYPSEFLQAAASGQPLDRELEVSRRDGSILELEVHGIPMHYRGERHVLTIARDITDKKRSAKELAQHRESLHQREKLAALGSLLAGVAHELNNPLSVVVARAVLLEERGDAATQAAAKKIRVAADRCARIVRTFLAMARQQRPERGPVAMNDVVTEALDLAAYALRTSSVEVVLDLADNIPRIEADSDQLHQVLLNLIINAQQALQEQPEMRRIRIESRFDPASNSIRVTVTDNGPGIPADIRARVFEPYFTTKPTGMGIGAGLAVSLGIIEAHGGTLTVDSPVEGGAAFSFVLPVGAAEPQAVDPDSSRRVADGRRTILVVDDEMDIREMLVDILRSARHRVVTAVSGREALQRLAEERFDVIITDIRMPDVDGVALYQQIVQRWPRLAERVVFVTGDTLTSTYREFVDRSGCLVLEKPFMPDDIRRVVVDLAVGGEVPSSG